MKKSTKAAAVAGIALVLSGGVAAAGTGSLPDAAQDGLSTASSHVGIELPASHDNHPQGNQESADEPEANVEHPDNHGADVSAVAKSDETTGREHGEAVSTVARDGHGQSNTGADHAADQASLGSGNAGDHGKP